MSLSFQCPTCGVRLKVEARFRGTRKTCPACKTKNEIPLDLGEEVKLPELPATITLPPKPVIESIKYATPPIPPSVPEVAPLEPIEIEVPEVPRRRPTRRREPDSIDERRERQASGQGSSAAHSLGVSSLVLGIFSLVLAIVPCAGVVALPVAGIGILLGFVGGILSLFRSGHGIGYPIAGTACNALALLIATFWIVFLSGFASAVAERGKGPGKIPQIIVANEDPPDGKVVTPDAQPDVPQATPMPKNDGWADASKDVVAVGEVRVRVMGVRVDKFQINDLGRVGPSTEDKLLVFLEVFNSSKTKKVEYRSWCPQITFTQGETASLGDEHGNHYLRVSPSFGQKFVNQVDRQSSIYPGKVLTEMLVFQVPVETATELRLTLPGRNVDQNGDYRFLIPSKLFRR